MKYSFFPFCRWRACGLGWGRGRGGRRAEQSPGSPAPRSRRRTPGWPPSTRRSGSSGPWPRRSRTASFSVTTRDDSCGDQAASRPWQNTRGELPFQLLDIRNCLDGQTADDHGQDAGEQLPLQLLLEIKAAEMVNSSLIRQLMTMAKTLENSFLFSYY